MYHVPMRPHSPQDMANCTKSHKMQQCINLIDKSTHTSSILCMTYLVDLMTTQPSPRGFCQSVCFFFVFAFNMQISHLPQNEWLSKQLSFKPSAIIQKKYYSFKQNFSLDELIQMAIFINVYTLKLHFILSHKKRIVAEVMTR